VPGGHPVPGDDRKRAIEDLAGNHISQPFDIDTFKHVTERIAAKTISLPFTIR
jgi:hypothetical protein